MEKDSSTPEKSPERKTVFSPDFFFCVPENIQKNDAEEWLVNYFHMNSQKLDAEYQRRNSRDKYFKRLGIGTSKLKEDELTRRKSEDSTPPGPVADYQMQILPRTDNEVRNSYLMKLKTNKLLEETPAKKHQTSSFKLKGMANKRK